MTTTVAEPAAAQEHVVERFTLYEADWDLYERMLRQVEAERRRVFITYDRGRMEMMAPSFEHDLGSERLGVLIRLLAEELGVELIGVGCTTFKRKDLKRGLEPDRCFYVRNASSIIGKAQIDLQSDPPPDLAIEVEISRRLLDRQSIYEALGVPELWRFDGKHVRVLRLQPDGSYAEAEISVWFPQVPLREVDRLLALGRSMGDTSWTIQVRQWLRKHLSTG